MFSSNYYIELANNFQGMKSSIYILLGASGFIFFMLANLFRNWLLGEK